MRTKYLKGTYGYLNHNKISQWKRAALMLAVPVIIFLAAWVINKSRNNVMTVVAIVGCLPGCNQVVRAIMASRYHSMEKSLYEETESARGERLALYENVFTSYEKNFYVDCVVISGREVVGYSSDQKTDTVKAAEHIRTILKGNSYKQNVKIFTERRAFLDRVRTLAANEPEAVPFKEDERYPGLTRDEIIQYLLMAISL
ncbi:MAG: hypothetical protein KH452_00405 [Clostridiales bacterium]|nr:hypothetical protein [Clostridiales bacterium]